MKHPNESRTLTNPLLVEQFQRKGYQCTRVEEQNATIIIFKHEKKKDQMQDNIIKEIMIPSYQKFVAN